MTGSGEEVSPLLAERQWDGGEGLYGSVVNDHDRASSTTSTTAEGDDQDGEALEGVRQIEAVSQAWTEWGLIFAYFGLVSTACSHL
jgi:hypothetical protein